MSFEDKVIRISLAERECLIRDNPFFLFLSDSEIKDFVSLLKEETKSAGDIIVREGDLVDAIYFIADGKAEVMRATTTVEKSVDIHLSFLTKSDMVGLAQTGFFSTNGIRTATVRAITPLVLLSISLSDFFNNIPKYPALKIIGERFALMNAIKTTPLCQQMESDKILHLLKNAKKLVFPANTTLFSSNGPADKCYFLISGHITAQGRDSSLENVTLEAGSFCGNSVLLPSESIYTSLCTLTDCELLELEQPILAAVVANKAKPTHKTIWQKLLELIGLATN